MNSITVYKGCAVVFWTTAALLFALGLSERQRDPLDEYALGCLCALLAMTFTGIAVLECTVSRIFRREAAVSRRHLAGATAEALADELEARHMLALQQPTGPSGGHGGATPIRGGR